MRIAFTGRCRDLAGNRITRYWMAQLIGRIGHQPQDNVTTATDLLIVGGGHLHRFSDQGMSGKESMALQRGTARITDEDFFQRFVRDNESLEDYVENTLRYPGQRYQVNGQDVTEQEFERARARAGRRVFGRVQEQDLVCASMNQAESILASEMSQYVEPVTEEQRSAAVHAVIHGRTTEEALADPRREEVMSDVREQMKDTPAHKPYSRGRKIRIRNHKKADYT